MTLRVMEVGLGNTSTVSAVELWVLCGVSHSAYYESVVITASSQSGNPRSNPMGSQFLILAL